MEIKEMFEYLNEVEVDAQKMMHTKNVVVTAWKDQEEKKRMSFLAFLGTQIRYISMFTWILQFLVLLLFTLGIFVMNHYVPSLKQESFFLLFPILPIVLCSITMYELLKSITYGMIELESGTRFDFPKVLLARILLLGMSDLCIMSIMVILSSSLMQYPLHYMILYVIVPVNVCICVTLSILHFQKSRNSMYSSLCFMFIYGICNTVMGQSYGIYEQLHIGLWKVMFVVSVMYLCVQGFLTLRSVQKKEQLFDKEEGNYVWN